MLEFRSFTGGITATNGYWVCAPEGTILVDAPEGVADWLDSEARSVDMLLLTHCHYDHVVDAATVKSRHGCSVHSYRQVSRELTLEALLNAHGIDIRVEDFLVDVELEGTESLSVAGLALDLLHVPGHSTDSLCFFHRKSGLLFAGDTLMSGGVGRSDFPGGSHELLITGIREKLLTLGDEVQVLSGHGPETTIGREKSSNPFL